MHGNKGINSDPRSDLDRSGGIRLDSQSDYGTNINGITDDLHGATWVSWGPTVNGIEEEAHRKRIRTIQWGIVGFSTIGVVGVLIQTLLHQIGV